MQSVNLHCDHDTQHFRTVKRIQGMHVHEWSVHLLLQHNLQWLNHVHHIASHVLVKRADRVWPGHCWQRMADTLATP
jgi:hypothetical protein